MFKFEWPWTRKKRLAEEAQREARLEKMRQRVARDRIQLDALKKGETPWHLAPAQHVSLSARAESRRVRELRERLEEEARLRRVRDEEDARRRDGDFLTSMVVAQATNSTMAGYLVGGNLAGAMVGDALVPDTEPKREETWHGNGGEVSGAGASASWEREEVRTPDPEPEPSRYESSPSYESSSSSSDSSSSDSGGGGGGSE